MATQKKKLMAATGSDIPVAESSEEKARRPRGARTAKPELVVAAKSKNFQPAPSVVGALDTISGVWVIGWAVDRADVSRRLSIEILCDKRIVAVTTAENFRSDVKETGVGDGYCGFSVPLPDSCCDGREHEISARVRGADAVLHGAVKYRKNATRLNGCIDGLSGSSLSGWVRNPASVDEPLSIRVWIDSRFMGEFPANLPFEQGGVARFLAEIPPEYLDGQIHHFLVEVAEHGFKLGEVFELTPAILTPYASLQRYGSTYLKANLSPGGALRYETLRSSLHALVQQQGRMDSGEMLDALKQLLQTHEQVVHGFKKRCTYEPIRFPVVDKPVVTVVVPVHDKFEVTYNCLASLAFARNRTSFEVILVDDGSTDETQNLGRIVSGITIVRNRVAQGFVRSCNRGAASARGDFVVLLNNDTEVTSGWIDELLEPFSRFDKVGMTGGKLLYPDGRLQEAGGMVWGSGDPWNVGRNGNASDPRFNYTRQVDYLSGACVMLPATLWNKLGGFDENFAPAYFEDTDLAFRVRDAGFKTIYTPFCQVVHFEGQSNGTSTDSGVKRYQRVNEPKFKAKWFPAYRNNGIIGRDSPHIVQDRNVNMRALVFDIQTLTPDRDAGSYSATQEIRLLQSLGFKVTFVPANMAYMAGYTEALQRMGVEVVYAPFAGSMVEVIEKRADEFDLFYVARYGVAEQVVDAIRRCKPSAKIVLNIHDLHFLRELREAVRTGDSAALKQAETTRDAELAVMKKVDLVVSYSEIEHAVILSHNANTTQVALCPWVVEAASDVPDYEDRKDIAFLGGFGHRPNVEAVEWFAGEVMPLLRKKLPGARFLVYGSNLPDAFKTLEDTDVVLKGYAATTEEVYDAARVFVAPLLAGAGLKGKVIGAFARGIPTVMTPVAAEGTGARHEQEAMIVSSPEEWVDAIVALYSDRNRWEAMSRACRSFAGNSYSFERGQSTMLRALKMAGIYASPVNDTLASRHIFRNV